MKHSIDVVIIGAGHNGLVAALLLARQGLRVLVAEAKDVIGGACRTERPFQTAPNLGASTGAYLLGLMPPELLQILQVEIPLIRRDPHYFLPTTDRRYLLFGSDYKQTKQQLTTFFSEADAQANEALQHELTQIREDIAPTWLEEPLSVEATAEKYVRSPLRSIFIDLCRKSVGDYLNRFDFKSDLIKAMYAATDGFSGVYGTWDTPGTGMNFLIHNMCRLPGSGGTWMSVKGGMGTVTRCLAEAVKQTEGEIETKRKATKILLDQGAAKGVLFQDGTEVRATTIVVNADPFQMRDLVGAENLPVDYNTRLDHYHRDGSSLKINLCLNGLPKFTCLPEDQGQYRTTIHLLPNEPDVIPTLQHGFAQAQAGRLPEFPVIEWYIHTALDPSLRDAEGHHNSALFVQWVPYNLQGTTWEKEESGYVKHLLSICDRFAPGTSNLVQEVFALHPQRIEQHFGLTRGHVHHVDNSFGFSDRLPYTTPIQGLYSASAACHPAGSVIGCAGYNAARQILRDMGCKASAANVTTL